MICLSSVNIIILNLSLVNIIIIIPQFLSEHICDKVIKKMNLYTSRLVCFYWLGVAATAPPPAMDVIVNATDEENLM